MDWVHTSYWTCGQENKIKHSPHDTNDQIRENQQKMIGFYGNLRSNKPPQLTAYYDTTASGQLAQCPTTVNPLMAMADILCYTKALPLGQAVENTCMPQRILQLPP